MTLAPGSRLGVYEIVALIGAGGMGEVYRARDTRLDRTVAVKVLPGDLAGASEFRGRLEREARSIAALNHPHICTLHDVGQHDGINFLVMEYVEGETLQDRLQRGALPLDYALQAAIQIAEALATAHRAGVIHRDLKPGNIMLVRRSGPPHAKLLDFGLAKTRPALGAGVSESMLPTSPPGLTAQGTIIGTLQYMAPEQLEGREADARSDIFAFGAIVYEMVTGRRAFDGTSPASVIAAILDREPPVMSSVQTLTPSLLDHLVQRCLSKDPDARWQTATDVLYQLKWMAEHSLQSGASRSVSAAGPGQVKHRLMRFAAGVVLAIGLAAGIASYFRSAPGDVRQIRFSVFAPPDVIMTNGTNNTVAVVSPDGRRVAFIGQREGVGPYQLWVRSLDPWTPIRWTALTPRRCHSGRQTAACLGSSRSAS